MEKFICKRCGNSQEQYIGYFNGIPYCRKCISFQGKEADSSFEVKKSLSLNLKYPLSERQQRVSDEVWAALEAKRNVLIHAVTGAGKTELVYQSIERFLQRGQHVGFATPRKDVVIDLYPRFSEAFEKADIVSVYGGHTSKLNGDIILLTTHQLFRYRQYFDLLVLDEIDAFPYRGNDVLNRFFKDSVKGNYVLLSATPSQEDLKKIKEENGVVVNLYERYHKHPLPLPIFEKDSLFSQKRRALCLIKEFQKQNKPVFLFVPTIEEGKKLFSFLSFFLQGGAFVSSKEEERRLDIERFKSGELSFLVTTSILERGVTVKNLQVIVYHSNHILFPSPALIQIAGRAGRKIDAPEGKVYFLSDELSDNVREAIYEIDRYNRKAHLL